MTEKPPLESTKNVVFNKLVETSILVIVSGIFAFISAIFISSENIITGTVNIMGIIGLIEIAFGSFFGVGFSEVAYASRAAGNPIYGETIFKDRLNYRTKQLISGFNLVFSGVLLLLISILLNSN